MDSLGFVVTTKCSIQVTKAYTYPLPRIEDMFAALSGGSVFSKVDLAHAYQQICIDDAPKAW